MGHVLTEHSSIPSRPTPPVLELPNELLSKTFGYLPMNSTLFAEKAPSQAGATAIDIPLLHPILILRQVCHRFRTVANELKLWYDDSFDLSQLAYNRGYATNPDLVDALLTDRHLASCLGKKTTWTFRRYDVFCIVLKRVPSFQQTAKRMIFSWASDSMNTLGLVPVDKTPFRILADSLSCCKALTTLQLVEIPELDFDCIPKYFPALEIFAVKYALHDPLRVWRGSLRGLSKPQRLSLINLGGAERRLPGFESVTERPVFDIFPITSFSSLTHLEIVDEQHKITNHVARSLSQLVNLTYLAVAPLSHEIVASIVKADFRLITFKADITFYPETDLGLIFSTSGFRGLQNLDLSFSHWGEPTMFLAVIDAIVTLAELQHVQLRMPMHHRVYPQLSQLVNLKSIAWAVTWFDIDYDAPDVLENKYNKKERVEREFGAAFQSFARSPVIKFTFEEYTIAAEDEDVGDDEYYNNYVLQGRYNAASD